VIVYAITGLDINEMLMAHDISKGYKQTHEYGLFKEISPITVYSQSPLCYATISDISYKVKRTHKKPSIIIKTFHTAEWTNSLFSPNGAYHVPY
jgi:hypothetical protein